MRHAAAVCLSLALSVFILASGGIPEQDLRFGLRVPADEWSAMVPVLAEHPADPGNPVGITLSIPESWALAPDWSALEEIQAAARSAEVRVHVLTELPFEPGSEESLAYLVALSNHLAPEVDTLALTISEQSFPVSLQEDPEQLALAVKRMTSAIRGARAHSAVLYGEVDRDSLGLIEPLYDKDLRAYVDGYTLRAIDESGSPDSMVMDFLGRHHPGSHRWLHLPRVKNPIASDLLILLAASRDATFVDVESETPADTWKALLALRGQLSPGTGPGFTSQSMAVKGAEGYRHDIGMIHLLDDLKMEQEVVLVPTVAGAKKETLRLELGTADVTEPRAFKLPMGPSVPVQQTTDDKSHETVLSVPFDGSPVLVSFDRLQTGTVGFDDISVEETYRIPVEYILARHHAVQQAQEVLLDHYTAIARVDYHFKVPGGAGSVDVTFINRFFYEEGLGARWVQEKLLLNGVEWKEKTIPELPILEPEKVNSLPLALTLGQDYSYRYIKDEVVEGRSCFVVEFIPLPEATGSLYIGKVWIDRETFKLVRQTVRQTELAEPMISSEETDKFEDITDPDGNVYRLMTALRGQQIYSVMGRNLFAERMIAFEEIEVNGAGYEAELQTALDSDKTILQETEQGLRYLQKEEDGTRVIQEKQSTRRLFAVGGLYSDKSLDFPLPIVGVNYFDYDFRGKGAQFNIFATGVVNSVNLAKIDFWPGVDARFDAVLFAIPFEDKVYPAGVEAEGLRIKELSEVASVGLGFRATEFFKISAGFDLKYYHYSRAEKTDPDLVLPSAHFDTSFNVSADYARRGWSVAGNAEYHRRSKWEPWGLLPDEDEAYRAKDYMKWDLRLGKTFYLPKFQKIGTSLVLLGGSDLDRFSGYRFVYLGRQKMAGFSGSGVRFDQGGLFHMYYEFNVADVIRLGFQADQARVRPDEDLRLWQNHTGVGIFGQVVGPWRTLWRVDVGYALASDLKPVQGDVTAAIVVMRLW